MPPLPRSTTLSEPRHLEPSIAPLHKIAPSVAPPEERRPAEGGRVGAGERHDLGRAAEGQMVAAGDGGAELRNGGGPGAQRASWGQLRKGSLWREDVAGSQRMATHAPDAQRCSMCMATHAPDALGCSVCMATHASDAQRCSMCMATHASDAHGAACAWPRMAGASKPGRDLASARATLTCCTATRLQAAGQRGRVVALRSNHSHPLWSLHRSALASAAQWSCR